MRPIDHERSEIEKTLSATQLRLAELAVERAEYERDEARHKAARAEHEATVAAVMADYAKKQAERELFPKLKIGGDS